MIATAAGVETEAISDAQVLEFKSAVTRALTPYASAVLLDSEFGMGAFGECLPLQGEDGVLRDWLFEFEPLQAGDDAQHWLLQLREADPRPEGGR